MAGDWIKVEHATLDKPEVSLFAELLGVPVDQGVGILVRFWVWLDRNARNGSVTHVTPSVMDTVMHCPGFSGAIVAVGWVSFDQALRTMTIPNFVRHNENTAKTRSCNAERQARYRSRHSNVTSVTKPLPEKRREEKSNTSLRSVLTAPTEEHIRLAGELGVPCLAEWVKYRDWLAASGKKHRDEAAGFRNWLKNAKGRAPPGRQTLAEQRAANMAKLTGKVRDERFESSAERVGNAVVLSLPSDLREPGGDDVGGRGPERSAASMG